MNLSKANKPARLMGKKMNADYYHYMFRTGHCLTTLDDIYHRDDLYRYLEWNIKQAMVFLWEE